MESLSTQKPIVDNEETLKAFTKHIYYKRTETIDELVEEVRGGALNFIGLINPEKKNTCSHRLSSHPCQHHAELHRVADILP